MIEDFIKQELRRYREEHPVQEVLIRVMRFSPKDLGKRTPTTKSPEYYHFASLEDALEFIQEAKEKYSKFGINPKKFLPGVWCFEPIEYVLIVRRFDLKKGSC